MVADGTAVSLLIPALILLVTVISIVHRKAKKKSIFPSICLGVILMLCFAMAPKFMDLLPSKDRTPDPVDPYEGMEFSPYYSQTQEGYILNSYRGDAEWLSVPAEYEGKPVLAIGTGAFSCCEKLERVTLEEGVLHIQENAFISCAALKEIDLPSTATKIDGTIVNDCKALERINVSSENPVYEGGFGLLIDKVQKKVIVGTKDAYLSNDCGITVIGAGAFSYSDIELLRLPDSIVIIEPYAFAGCDKLTVVELPGSITRIEDHAFAGCDNLRMVNISENTTFLGEGVFYACPKLERIIIPDGVTTLKRELFYGCSSLSQIVIGKNVTSVEYGAFVNCTGLREIYYNGTPEQWQWLLVDPSNRSPLSVNVYYFSGNGVPDERYLYWYYEYIGDWFYEDSGYNNSETYWGRPVIIGDSFYDNHGFEFALNADGRSYALKSCGWLPEEYDTVIIPSTYRGLPITVIQKMAFAGECFKEVVLPDTILTIEDEAFFWSDLEKIVIPKSVVSIGVSVFALCSNLESIEVDAGNPVYFSAGNCLIERSTKTLIAGCKESKIPNDGSVAKIGAYAFYQCHALGHYFEIPEGVTHIGELAFGECYGLMKIVLPSTLQKIDDWAFNGCVNLVEIDNHSSLVIDNKWDFGGIGYYAKHIYNSNKSSASSILSVGGFGTSHVLVFYRDGATYTLLGSSFEDYEEIWLPTSCNGESYKINECAFYGNKMSHLEIRGGVLEIGYNAFADCKNLKSVLIWNDTGSIASSAFQNSSVESIYYRGTYEEWCAAGYTELNLNEKTVCYFYSETQPADSSRSYWHYVNGEIVAW